MKTFCFNDYDEVSAFIAFCEENKINHEFNRVAKWVMVDESFESECEHFIESNLDIEEV